MFILTILDKEDCFSLEQKNWKLDAVSRRLKLTVAVADTGLLCCNFSNCLESLETVHVEESFGIWS